MNGEELKLVVGVWEGRFGEGLKNLWVSNGTPAWFGFPGEAMKQKRFDSNSNSNSLCGY